MTFSTFSDIKHAPNKVLFDYAFKLISTDYLLSLKLSKCYEYSERDLTGCFYLSFPCRFRQAGQAILSIIVCTARGELIRKGVYNAKEPRWIPFVEITSAH